MNKNTRKLTQFTIDLTENCNLSCVYCFQNLLEGKSVKERKKRDITEEKLLKAIENIFSDKWSGKMHKQESINVGFWGGEPMLQWNKIKKAIYKQLELSKQTGKKVIFNMTTNGTIYPEDFDKVYNDVLNKGSFLELMISIDGIEKIHSKNRPFVGGKSSWDIVKKNYIKYNKKYGFQLRYTPTNDTVQYMHEIEKYWKDHGIYSTVFSPANEGIWTKEQIREYYDQIRKITIDFLDYRVNKNINVRNTFIERYYNQIFDNKINKGKQEMIDEKKDGVYGCGQGKAYVGISVDGDIYPCHRFNKHQEKPEERKFKIGNIFDDWYEEEKTKLENTVFYPYVNKDENGIDKTITGNDCEYCPIVLQCKGGCIQVNQDVEGKYDKNRKIKNSTQCKLSLQNYAGVKQGINDFLKDNNNLIKLINTNKTKKNKKPQNCSCNESYYNNDIDFLKLKKFNSEDKENLKKFFLSLYDVQKIGQKDLNKDNKGCMCNQGKYSQDADININNIVKSINEENYHVLQYYIEKIKNRGEKNEDVNKQFFI